MTQYEAIAHLRLMLIETREATRQLDLDLEDLRGVDRNRRLARLRLDIEALGKAIGALSVVERT